MAADKLRDAELKGGLHTFFKLQTTISTTIFDHLGCLKYVPFGNNLSLKMWHNDSFPLVKVDCFCFCLFSVIVNYLRRCYDNVEQILREFYTIRLVLLFNK
jgi:hypothetical protein